MGIQISFDTDGITEGLVEGPKDQVVYHFRSVDGMEGTHDVTEGFQERVEPPIIDLQRVLAERVDHREDFRRILGVAERRFLD